MNYPILSSEIELTIDSQSRKFSAKERAPREESLFRKVSLARIRRWFLKQSYLLHGSGSFANSMRKHNVLAKLLSWRRIKVFLGLLAGHDYITPSHPRLTGSTRYPQDLAPQAVPSKHFTAFPVTVAYHHWPSYQSAEGAFSPVSVG